MNTALSDLFTFLEIAAKKDFFNAHTIGSRRTAVNKFVEILDEDQQTVEYLRDNLDVVKARFTNRYPEVRGNTVEVYGNRVQLVLNDFFAWKADRAAWEREVAARQRRSTTGGDAEKRARPEKPKVAAGDDPDTRAVKIPLPSGFEVEIKVPRNLSVADLRRVLWGLLPYASDWDPTESPRQTFPQLGGERDELHTRG